jgi:hypothetical protein
MGEPTCIPGGTPVADFDIDVLVLGEHEVFRRSFTQIMPTFALCRPWAGIRWQAG